MSTNTVVKHTMTAQEFENEFFLSMFWACSGLSAIALILFHFHLVF